MGYHNKEIKRGVHGEPSKIQEELDELNDALEQDNVIMALLELSDLYLAIEAVAIKLGSNIENVRTMALATKRAFESGERKSKGWVSKEPFSELEKIIESDTVFDEKELNHDWYLDFSLSHIKIYKCHHCGCSKTIEKEITKYFYRNGKFYGGRPPPCRPLKHDYESISSNGGLRKYKCTNCDLVLISEESVHGLKYKRYYIKGESSHQLFEPQCKEKELKLKEDNLSKEPPYYTTTK